MRTGIVEVEIPYSCRTCGYCVAVHDTDEKNLHVVKTDWKVLRSDDGV